MENSCQYRDELFADSLFKNGDKTQLAKLRGVSVSEISQQLNPNEPRKSDFHKGAQFLRDLRTLGGDKAERALAYYTGIIESPADHGCPASVTAELHREHSEFVSAHLEKQPIHVQIAELTDVRVKVDRALAVLKGQMVDRKSEQVAVGTQAVTVRRKVS